MSEVENQSLETQSDTEVKGQGNAVLLPESSVAVFSKDKETLESARTLETDWRFARVVVGVEEGNIDSAIQSYQEFESPDLLIIQTDSMDEGFMAKLEELASHCDEDTAAIIVGPVNDVYLYRKMIDMGISDYLVKPIAADVMAEVCAKTLIEKIGVKGSRLIAFIGAKGGVGTSLLCQAAASCASEFLDQKTFLLDTCGGWSTLSVGLGFEPATTLVEAARASDAQDEDSLNRMIHTVSDKLSVLASGGDVMLDQSLSPEQLENMVDLLMVKYPVVFVDLSQSSQALQRVVLSRAHQINVVSSQSLVSLRQGRSLIQEIKDLRGGDGEGVELIINMQGLASAQEVPKKDIESAMDLKVSAFLPFDAKMFQGNESASRRITDDQDGASLIKKTILPILQNVITSGVVMNDDDDDEEKGFLGGLINKLSSK